MLIEFDFNDDLQQKYIVCKNRANKLRMYVGEINEFNN